MFVRVGDGHRNVTLGVHNMTVIFTVFCGRRRYMVLLMRYVTLMLERGTVDECHLWDYTRDLQDHKYLASLAALGNPKIKVVQVSNKASFGEYYQFYAKCGGATTLIKSDDDIVYIDVDAMPALLSFRSAHPEHLLVLPMMLNNGVCAHLMQQRGRLPSGPHTFELKEGGFEQLVGDGDKAVWLHEWFLANPCQMAGDAGEVVLPPRQRISINMFAISAADLPLLAHPGVTADDERCLTVDIPSAERRTNCIFAGALVSHFGFGPQRETGLEGEVEATLLTKYAAL